MWTLHADETEAVKDIGETICWMEEKLEADASVIAFSDPTGSYFRKEILPSYKENRKGQRKPVVHKALVDHMKDAYKTYTKPGLEGDDILGILSTHPTLIEGEKVIVSVDKDFGTVPGLWAKGAGAGEDEIEEVTVEQANYFHMIQTLTGDTTDGYCGCPGVGPKTAAKILDVRETMPVDADPAPYMRRRWWRAVVEAFTRAGFGEEEALVQTRMARILRAEDYDFKKKEVILWTP